MNLIEKLSASSIESQIELIQFFIDRTKDLKSAEYIEQISDFLMEKEKIPDFCSYHLIGHRYALGCLTGSFLYHYSRGEDTELLKEHLIHLLNYIKAFYPSSSSLLKMTTTASWSVCWTNSGFLTTTINHLIHRCWFTIYLFNDRIQMRCIFLISIAWPASGQRKIVYTLSIYSCTKWAIYSQTTLQKIPVRCRNPFWNSTADIILWRGFSRNIRWPIFSGCNDGYRICRKKSTFKKTVWKGTGNS